MTKWLEYFWISRSGYFDAAYYLINNPDVRAADIDPLWHFINFGWKEGRNPCSWFETNYYLELNPDIKKSGMNPFVHYLRYGYKEGRYPNPHRRSYLYPKASPVRGQNLSGLRVYIYRLGKFIFNSLPDRYRWRLLHWLYQRFGLLLKGFPHYENWRKSHQNKYLFSPRDFFLIDLNTVQPAKEVKGSIAIHLHIFYSEVVDEFASLLVNMPFPYDLYISTPHSKIVKKCEDYFTNLPQLRKRIIKQVQNRGRNFAPLFCAFGEELQRYDFIAHLHSKKSEYNKGATKGWREYLTNCLLGNEQQIRKIFALLQDDEPRGLVYPQNYYLLPYWANTWLANESLARIWIGRLGISKMPRGYFDYPAGSMFWAKVKALEPIFNLKLTWEDFPEEIGQTDGTLAHTLERLLVLCSLEQGLKPAILIDHIHPSWSPWRLDQYINRSYESLVESFADPSVKLIAFDIYDTLLSRPLLNPQTIKEIVAKKVPSPIGDSYRRFRDIAEDQARTIKGKDVDIKDIYYHLGKITNLSEDTIFMLRELEQSVESSLVEARSSGIELYYRALSTGKPVILISDMFLPRDVIENSLIRVGIRDWHSIYLSNEIGLRKDTGQLYKYVLEQFKIEPHEMLVVGDSERSDVQIPIDMGMRSIHLMRPVELARGLPRFAHIIDSIENYQGDDRIDTEILLGLVLNKNYSSLSLTNLDIESIVIPAPYYIGYSLVGPLLLSFVDWLLERAKEDHIDHFYFLSREGKLIKSVYDEWCHGRNDAPQSDYLVISRRAASVASITSFDDILNIAKVEYFPNTIENFLYTRYGLRLSEERWTVLSDKSGWDSSRLVHVQNKNIKQLIPLLQELVDDIFIRSQHEKRGLLRYLAGLEIEKKTNPAVVDVGYSGSVQKYLNLLLSKRVHGFYLMTDENAQKLAEEYNVIARGCFYEFLNKTTNLPVLYKLSFELEKLISYNEPQIQHYVLLENNSLKAVYRELNEIEIASKSIQEHIHEGAMDFVKDARQIWLSLERRFHPSKKLALLLMEEFLGRLSTQERQLLEEIVIDDHYCGRGLV